MANPTQSPPKPASGWRAWAEEIRRDVVALWFAVRDPRTPWYAKLIGGLVLAYALSPVDLIPDFIPILGYLDDLILVPLGLLLVTWLIPAEVFAEHKAKADPGYGLPKSLIAGVVIFSLWALAAIGLGFWVQYELRHWDVPV
jgi:uncharacterized membrane protein YkvA (DUF1232 family)